MLDAELAPHLLIQLEDDLERSRMREAFWISVAVHLAVVLFLFFTPTIFPGIKGVVLISPEDLMRNQQMTYLDLPPDMQKAPKVAPKTNVLSDKNRIAESQHPTIDKKTLEELKRAGPPKLPSPPAQQQAQAAPAQPAQQAPPQQHPNQQQGQEMAQLQNAIPQDNPRLPQPQQGTPNFRAMMSSPGTLVADAARAVAAGRTGGSSGAGGYYGVGPGGSALKMGPAEVLSDTQGVDFGPYLSRVLDAVRRNWYNLIPEEARPPLLKKGKVSIDFVIRPDGSVAGLHFMAGGQSGDVALDRAAWGGITASYPFAPLPTQFHGPYLALRFHFFYNPGKGDLD